MAEAVRFVYSGIRVRNLARSERFYRSLGFRVVKRGWFSHGGRWVHLVLPGSDHRIELNYYPKGSAFYTPLGPGEEFDHFGFYAEDPRRWVRKALKAGATPMTGFVDGAAQLVFVRDPDGVWLGAYGPGLPTKRSRGPPRRKRPRSRT
jgi:catechol 2,3-dioxygenase-like lactoylglutathione lyase family enzyme